MKQSPREAGDLISQILAVRRVGWNWRLLKFHQRADLITIPPTHAGKAREKSEVFGLPRSIGASFPGESAPTSYRVVNFSRKASPSIAFFLGYAARPAMRMHGVELLSGIFRQGMPRKISKRSRLPHPSRLSKFFTLAYRGRAFLAVECADIAPPWRMIRGLTTATSITARRLALFISWRAMIFLKNIEISILKLDYAQSSDSSCWIKEARVDNLE